MVDFTFCCHIELRNKWPLCSKKIKNESIEILYDIIVPQNEDQQLHSERG